jgi:hypothetical protein
LGKVEEGRIAKIDSLKGIRLKLTKYTKKAAIHLAK